MSLRIADFCFCKSTLLRFQNIHGCIRLSCIVVPFYIQIIFRIDVYNEKISVAKNMLII